MGFNSRSPLFFVVAITSVIFVIFYTFTEILNKSDVPEDKGIVIRNGGEEEAPLYLGGTERLRASPSFLLESERSRKNFLKKLEREILKGRDPSELPASGKVNAKTWSDWFWNVDVHSKWFALWNVFTPVYSCPHVLSRVGILTDGGKWTCGVDVFEKTKEDPCVVYSFGVAGDSTFEMEMVERTNCTVYGYDHTVDGMTFPKDLDQKLKERIHFFKVGIGSKAQVKGNPDVKIKTLKELMKQNGHDWIDFLKMDIERNEFSVLKDIAEDFKTFPFGHLNLEVHLSLEKREENSFGKIYDLWTILERKGLRAFFWEPNFQAVFNNDPSCMEFSFINVADSKSRLLRF